MRQLPLLCFPSPRLFYILGVNWFDFRGDSLSDFRGVFRGAFSSNFRGDFRGVPPENFPAAGW
ncbi:MAG: hypothetical protein DA443_09725 [Bacteroidetes bacterium]|nr:MAG: hypothetical protein DA443_09725 [Bacteroidota bacterium]